MFKYDNPVYEESKETHEFDLMDGLRGPIDLLLRLCKDNKVEIKDIFLSNITEQYVEYVNSLQKLDLEKASSFVVFASELLSLKIQGLLPKTDEEEIQYQDDTFRFFNTVTMAELLVQMRENLAERQVGTRYFVEPEYTEEDCRVVLSGFDVENLAKAYMKIKENEIIRYVGKKPTAKTITKDRFTVRDKTQELILRLNEKNEISFTDIALKEYTIGEKINAFLALLELLRCQFAEVDQEKPFGEITIRKSENADNVDLKGLLSADLDSYESEEEDEKKKKKGKKEE